jgi:hypothetical protein
MEYLFNTLASIATIIGIILVAKALKIVKHSKKEDEILFSNKDLSDEDFHKMREERVFKPQRRADKLGTLAIILQLPLAALNLSKDPLFNKIVGLICAVLFIIILIGKIAKRHY